MTTRFRVQAALPTCSDHPNEDLDSFCDTCKKRICELCCKGEHKADDWRRAKKVVREIKQNGGERSGEVKNLIKGMKKKKKASSRKVKANLESIDATQKLLVHLIDQQADILRAKVKEGKKTKDLLSKGIKDFKALLDFFENHLYSADDNVVIEMEEQFHKLKDLYSESQIRDKSVQFIQGPIDPDTIKGIFGEVLESSRLKFEVTEKSQFTHTGGASIQTIRPVTSDEALVYRKNCTQVEQLHFSGMTVSEKHLPTKINDFVMCHQDSIVYTQSEDKIIRSISSSGIIIDVYSTAPLHPSSICRSRDGGLLVCLSDSTYISEGSKGEVHHVNGNGKLLKRYCRTEGDETNLLTSPKRVSQNVNLDLCMLQYLEKEYKPGLLVISNGSKFRFTYSGLPELSGFDPDDVCCDQFGRILMCDFQTDTVHLLHEDGDFLQYLVTKKSLSGPRSIALLDDMIWVGCYNGIIRVYKYGEKED